MARLHLLLMLVRSGHVVRWGVWVKGGKDSGTHNPETITLCPSMSEATGERPIYLVPLP